MPPLHPSTGGDVLDQALHVAKTQAAGKGVQGQQGFFQSLKPTNAAFAQTSRVNVARPAAQKKQQAKVVPAPQEHHTLLGTSESTSATPEEQAFLARQNYKDANATAPVREQAKKIEQAYVRGDDLKRTKKPIHADSNGTGLQGAASVSAPIGAVGQRALGSLAAGIPFGSVNTLALKGIQSLGLPTDERQQVIGGFAKDKSLDTPIQQAALVALAKSRGNTLPAHPTTRQLLTAALSPAQHHGSYWDAVNPINIAKDALYTPVYAAEGGYALGHATGEAIQGRPDEIKAVGKQQLQTLEHPGAFLQQHPFQAALSIAAPIKGLGKLGGLATGAEAAERIVPTSEALGGINLDRGTLSTNLVDRAAQKVSDKALSKSTVLQSREIAKGVRREGNLARVENAHSLKQVGQPLIDAGKNISRQRRDALLANEANGGTAQEWADHYNRLADESQAAGKTKLAKVQRAQAKVRAQQAKKWPDPLSPDEQAYVDAAKTAADTRTNMLLETKTPKGNAALDPVSAKWRDYQHNVELRANQGDELAQNVVSARNALNSVDPTSEHYGPAVGALDKTLDAYIASTDAAPFRVPTLRPKLTSEFGSPGNAVRANTNPKDLVTGLRHSTGGALESGNYTTSSANFNRQIAQPHTLKTAIDYVNRVSEKFGRPAVPGETIPEGMVLRDIHNLRTTPKVNITAEHDLETQADHLASVADEFKDPKLTGMSVVPDKGKYLLLPRSAYDEITQTVAKVPRGADGLRKATQAYKNSVLFSRIAYPVTNFVNSAAQAGLGGAGPLSFARRNALELPHGVEDAGFIAQDFNRAGREGFRSAIDQAKVSPGAVAKTGAVTHGVGRFVNEQYLDRIKTASIASDNVWRKALYVRHALPEARKLAHPDQGAISRLLARKRASDSAIQDAARAMAKGETPEARRAADRAVAKTNDFLGEFASMKRYKTLDLAVPFNSWTRFSGKLLLQTLPLKYPGRTALLYRLGQLGQQGTAQQGVLPQYLQETIPFGGDNPQRQGQINTERANPFATLGNVAPLSDLGGASTEEVLGNLSPFVAPGIEALTGNDLQTGRVLKDEKGNPIKGNPTDLARFLGAQALGFVPPLSALTGGGSGRADTSLPIPLVPGGVQDKPASSAGPLMQRAGQPGWLAALNQVLPVHVGYTNMHAQQSYGADDLRTQLSGEIAKRNKALLKTPGGLKQITDEATKLADKINKNLAYYQAHPEAVKKLLSSGTGGNP